jgi:putative heme iron utilization protein
VSLQGTARRIPSSSPDLSGCRTAYLARFPEAEPMFGFADFSIFLIRPVSVRFVAGFGEAHSLSAETLAQLLQQR